MDHCHLPGSGADDLKTLQKEYIKATNRLLKWKKNFVLSKIKKENNKMKLYNTLTKKKEEFVPLQEGKVTMYVCGTYGI